MEIKVESVRDNTGGDGFHLLELATVHRGHKLRWSTKTYERSVVKNPSGLFTAINSFLNTLAPEDTDHIWDIYENIYRNINEFSQCSPVEVNTRLTRLYTDLLDSVSVVDVTEHLEACGLVVFPEGMTEEFSGLGREDTTCTTGTYLRICAVATVLKLFLPVLGEHFNNFKYGNTTGNAFKEFAVVRMIRETELMSSVHVGWVKNYLAQTKQPSAKLDTGIHNCIGSEEVDDWLLSQVMLRKFAIGEIDNPAVDLIKNTFTLAANKAKAIDSLWKNTNHMAKFSAESMSSEEDGNTSSAERFRGKEVVAGDVSLALYRILETPEAFIHSMAPDINKTMLQGTTRYLKQSPVRDLTIEQLVVGALTALRVVSPSNVLYTIGDAGYRIAVLSQAVLGDLGFYQIALYLTARREDRDYSVMSPPRTKPSLTKVQIQTCMGLYKHYGRQQKRGERIAKESVGKPWIDQVVSTHRGYDWTVDAPKWLLDATGVEQGSPFELTKEFTTELYELLLLRGTV